MRTIIFKSAALQQYNYWATNDSRIQSKISSLLIEAIETPFTGKGKPEPLKNELAGY